MFEMAEKDFPVDKTASYMIGDKLLDTEAGHRFGVTSILVGTGYGAELIKNSRKKVKNRPMIIMQRILARQHSGYWKENKTGDLGITDKKLLARSGTKKIQGVHII